MLTSVPLAQAKDVDQTYVTVKRYALTLTYQSTYLPEQHLTGAWSWWVLIGLVRSRAGSLHHSIVSKVEQDPLPFGEAGQAHPI